MDEKTGYVQSVAKPCECKQATRLAYIESMIPPLYKTAKLEDIEPWLQKHTKQAQVVAEIKKNPDASYLFIGASGTGKTYMAYALWRHAAVSGKRGVAIQMSELASELQEYETTRDESWRPKLLPEDLKQDAFKYTIFIDEIQASRVSAFTAEKVFQIIKACIDFGHQLIVTSMKSEEGLRDHFTQADDTYGQAIVRRLTEKTTVVEMF